MFKKSLAVAALAAALTVQTAAAAPVFNLFELGIQNGKTAHYDDIGSRNITASVGGEKGTPAMYSVKRKDNPNLAYMVEIYADNAAYQAHLQSPQYKAFLQASPQILTDHKKRIELVSQFLGDKTVRQSAATRTNLVIVDVKPEHAAAFARTVHDEMAQAVAKERGVRAIYAATEKSAPNRWYFFEIYADDAAYQAHRLTPHFQTYLKQTADMTASKQAVGITPALLQNKGGLRFDVLKSRE
ncbi:putative quinol monooxygenase [Neisseria chenwenguii]|uniref:Antibiotic biosynthesis monooxygenase n=1 Tax=Neisseria chenwenguii TaxID=1853278 RepID=A0A220S4F7_9NEIS|nr:antibiotic biosynthesis monooxygenase [Neisseria chenwenguii]ASK28228.1 antibiotic biosynthesis monooxygenase [Neisseria chenwenguii]ROV57352.1 antibiotic biosynthesis monooxygenase [Neisseria chenwenguii]